MLGFLSDRKNCIAFLVIGWLVRGMVYHFFPLFNDILLWISLIWPGLILCASAVRRQLKPDRLTVILTAFLAAALLSTLANLSSVNAYQTLDTPNVYLSLYQGLILAAVLFASAKYGDKASYSIFLDRLFLAVFAYICLLSAASLILYFCYRAGISLPGGFGGEDQIFTYGHLGEDQRFCGLFGYSADGGNLCSIAAAMAVYFYARKKIPLPVCLCFIALLAYTIVLLDVRTSMVALLLNTLIFGGYLLSRKTGVKKAAGIMTAAGLVLIAAVIVLKQDTLLRYWQMFQEDPHKTLSFLTTGRSKYWELAVKGWLERPILGWGWLNNTFVGPYFDNHNLFFNLLLWTGAAGVGLFILFWIFWLMRIRQNRGTIQIGIVLIMTAVFVQSMLDRAIMGTANFGVETMCFWLCAGYAAYIGSPEK